MIRSASTLLAAFLVLGVAGVGRAQSSVPSVATSQALAARDGRVPRGARPRPAFSAVHRHASTAGTTSTTPATGRHARTAPASSSTRRACCGRRPRWRDCVRRSRDEYLPLRASRRDVPRRRHVGSRARRVPHVRRSRGTSDARSPPTSRPVYGQAFAVYALAAAHAVTGDAATLELARKAGAGSSRTTVRPGSPATGAPSSRTARRSRRADGRERPVTRESIEGPASLRTMNDHIHLLEAYAELLRDRGPTPNCARAPRSCSSFVRDRLFGRARLPVLRAAAGRPSGAGARCPSVTTSRRRS